MALHTRKSFAKLCGITEQQVAVYVQRNKIICVGKKIDDTLPENIEFMESKLSKSSGIKHVEVRVKPAMTKEEEAAYNLRLEESATSRKIKRGLDEKKQEKFNEEIELLKIKREKMIGNYIPVELVKVLFQQEFKQLVISFQQGADILIMEISKKKS